MVDPTLIRDHFDEVRTRLEARGGSAADALARLQELDQARRRILPTVENLKRDRNQAGELIAKAKRAGEDATALLDANKTRADEIKTLDAELAQIEDARNQALLRLPNIPHESVPVGKSAEDNKIVRQHGEPPKFTFEPKPHWDLGTELGILDFERATRLARARFAALIGPGARLSRALIEFMLDLHTREHGYTEVEPPFLVNSKALLGTGNLPKFEEDLFKISGDWDLYLIPTAEVPLTNLHREEILD